MAGDRKDEPDVTLETEQKLETERERFKALIENAMDIITVLDVNGIICFVSPAVERILGYKPEELIGKEAFSFIHPDDLANAEKDFASMTGQEGSSLVMESRLRHKDGSWHTFETISRSLLHNPSVRGIIFNQRDITKRKKAEDALRESEERYRLLFERNPLPMWVYDKETLAFLAVNEAAIEHYGYSRDEFLSMTIKDIRSSEDVAALLRKVSLPRTKLDQAGVWRHVKKNGVVIDVEVTAYPLNFAGRPAVLILANDATERKRAEESLRESEERLARVIETAPSGIVILDREGRMIFANTTAEKILGVSRDELVTRTYDDARWRLSTAEGKPILPSNLPFAQVVHSGTPVYDVHIAVQRPDGTRVILSVNAAPLRSADGTVTGVVISLTDVTERRMAEEAAAQRQREVMTLLDSLPGYTFFKDANSVYILANQVFADAVGVPADEIPGKTDYDLFPRDLAEKYRADDRKLVETGHAVQVGEEEFTVGDHRIIVATRKVPLKDERGNVIGLIGLGFDLTERKQREQALQEAEAKYRSLVEESLVGVYLIQDGVFVYANPRFAEIMGYTPEEILGKSVMDFTAPESRALVAENIHKRITGESQSIRYTFKGLRKDGKVVDLEVLGSRTMYHGRQAIIGSLLDITERKKAEQEQRELEEHKKEFYRRTILAATDGKLVITDRQEIDNIAGPPIATWQIVNGEDLGRIRRKTARIAEDYGMDKDGVFDFMLAVGEATTNAYKHAGGGTASLHRINSSLMIVVSDHGKGMEALVLPEVALKRGYSTAKSMGMGYKAMISVADRVYLATEPMGTTVGVQMGIHAPVPALAVLSLPDTWIA